MDMSPPSNGSTQSMAPAPMSNANMTMTMTMSTAMHNSFYWGRDAIILFAGWPERSLRMYLLALFLVLNLGISVEVLSVWALTKRGTNNPKRRALIQACVHVIRMAFAYMVMLAVMSYNIGVFIAAVVGHGIGFFLVRAYAGKARQSSSSDSAKF